MSATVLWIWVLGSNPHVKGTTTRKMLVVALAAPSAGAKRKERKMPMEVKRYFCQGKEITLEEAKKIDEENKALIASPLLVDWEKIKVVTVLKEKE